MTTYIDDNTAAFDNTLLTITLDPETSQEDISRADVHVGELVKTYKNPTFPLKVNLNSQETSRLFGTAFVRLKIYDSKGRGEMCDGYLEINIEDWKLGKV